MGEVLDAMRLEFVTSVRACERAGVRACSLETQTLGLAWVLGAACAGLRGMQEDYIRRASVEQGGGLCQSHVARCRWPQGDGSVGRAAHLSL